MAIVGIMLAAGAARRKGRSKPLLELEVEALAVLGHEADRARARLAPRSGA